MLSRTEYAFWTQRTDRREVAALHADSLSPLLDAGLVDWIEAPHALCREVSLVPTPGHTPGHISVSIISAGSEALITGDLVHHPCQVAEPHWASVADVDVEAARATRLATLGHCADGAVLLLGTHFCSPSGGHVARDGPGERFSWSPRARP